MLEIMIKLSDFLPIIMNLHCFKCFEVTKNIVLRYKIDNKFCIQLYYDK